MVRTRLRKNSLQSKLNESKRIPRQVLRYSSSDTSQKVLLTLIYEPWCSEALGSCSFPTNTIRLSPLNTTSKSSGICLGSTFSSSISFWLWTLSLPKSIDTKSSLISLSDRLALVGFSLGSLRSNLFSSMICFCRSLKFTNCRLSLPCMGTVPSGLSISCSAGSQNITASLSYFICGSCFRTRLPPAAFTTVLFLAVHRALQHLINNFPIKVLMPKVIDNYVLEQKIGSGQFGDVYKGYNKDTLVDIAVKVIRRESLKGIALLDEGKFSELLENEIKVLKCCNCPNIIRLYDLKKTTNNFYLIMEYCNQGDLSVYLKRTRTLSEREAVGFLLQILNGFRTLVAKKVLHRDFKLANILKHNGQLKIADFGFSKLLGGEDYASTVLGSPLHMAPEVIGGNQYNNKADVWSLGTVFYEMLYGKPPYNAANMVDLINNIKKKPLEFPKDINTVSETTQEIIRRMLTVSPTERISWQELFEHPIHNLFDEKPKMQKVPSQSKSPETNSTNQSQPQPEDCKIIDTEPAQKKTPEPVQIHRTEQTRESPDKKEIPAVKKTTKQVEVLKQLNIKDHFKRNGNMLLHYRNIYVFLAAVSEDAMSNHEVQNSEVIGYLLLRKLLSLIGWLSQITQGKAVLPTAEYWSQFMKEKDFIDIKQYIAKEHEVFKTFHKNIYSKLISKLSGYPPEVQEAVQNIEVEVDVLLSKKLPDYIKESLKCLREPKNKSTESLKRSWLHLDRCVDCMDVFRSFRFEQPDGQPFNFRRYYQSSKTYSLEQLMKRVEGRCKNM